MFSLALQLSLERNINRQVVNNIKGSTIKRNTAASTYRYERSYAPLASMANGKINTSRSEPDIARRSVPKRSAPPQRGLTTRSNQRPERPNSQFIIGTSSMPKLQSPKMMNSTSLTKANDQFIYSTVDVSKTSSRPPVFENTPKSKGDSG